MENKVYIAIDLKSFYASVECVERNLDPLDTNLVVADPGRTEKTICLAVSPSLKQYGISGRARLFEVIQKVNEVNYERKIKNKGKQFKGESYIDSELKRSPDLSLSYITAPPQMALYMKWSTEIYNIYLKYIAPEDIHVYSVDEVFMDVTNYLETYKMTPSELAMTMIRDVLRTTGITATAGIGTNLYLCKVAMDVMAKKIKPDKNGVRIAWLDEMEYRKQLWSHRPITDFWRVGQGYAKKLESNGLYTMGDIARCSVGKPNDRFNEDLLYKLFGVNAELLIDHAWGFENCTISDIKSYKPENNSISSGQVLHEPYNFEKAKLIVREMADLLSLDLVDKSLVTDQIVLTINYDVDNLKIAERAKEYKGEITVDRYGRKVPKHSHGTENLGLYTSSSKIITNAFMNLYDRITDRNLLIRRINIVANRVLQENFSLNETKNEQLDMFSDYNEKVEERKQKELRLQKEKNMQKAVISMKKKYGKNAVLKGMNLQEGATSMDRNRQIGGHKA